MGLCSATLVVSGCSATHARPAAGPTPSGSAPTSSRPNAAVTGLSAAAVADGYAGLSLRCHAQITNGRLTAPFWMQFDHFDPARGRAGHDVRQVLAAYATDPATRSFPQRRLHVAYADYSDRNGPGRPPVAVWIVVSYDVRAISSMSSTAMRADDVAILTDDGLRSSGIIEGLPSRCR